MKKLFLIIIMYNISFGATLSLYPSSNSLIIYNGGIALVHEKRDLSVQKNDSTITYVGVASSIESDSVNVKLDDSISLYSQQYRFDKLTQKKLLNAHVTKRVQVVTLKDTKNPKLIDATLLANNGSLSIVKSDEGKIITVNSMDIIFNTIPDELITKPSLVWNISAKKDIKTDMQIDYLIKNINWKSDYILNIDKNKANLVGWISIDNRSGKSFTNTQLHVLAGEINRANRATRNYKIARSMLMVQDSVANVSHKAHEGYHFYTIPFKVNLSNNEKTQIKFITQSNINIKRKYTSTMTNPNYLKGEIEHDVIQHVRLQELNYPLPKGIIRSYSKLKDTNILLGESYIKHTPKSTPITFKLGKNFDIKVKETLINYDNGTWNLDIYTKYNIKNSSDEIKTVEILIPFNKNNGSEIKSDEKYTFTKGNFATFSIIVKPQSTKEFNVHFRTKNKG